MQCQRYCLCYKTQTHTYPHTHKQSRFHLPSLSFIIILLQGHQGRKVITGTVAVETVKATYSTRNSKNSKLVE